MNKRYKYQEVAERIKMDIFVNYQAPSKPIPSIREYAEVSDGKLMETQTANYFSDIYPIDCAVLSANA